MIVFHTSFRTLICASASGNLDNPACFVPTLRLFILGAIGAVAILLRCCSKPNEANIDSFTKITERRGPAEYGWFHCAPTRFVMPATACRCSLVRAHSYEAGLKRSG